MSLTTATDLAQRVGLPRSAVVRLLAELGRAPAETTAEGVELYPVALLPTLRRAAFASPGVPCPAEPRRPRGRHRRP